MQLKSHPLLQMADQYQSSSVTSLSKLNVKMAIPHNLTSNMSSQLVGTGALTTVAVESGPYGLWTGH